MPPDYERLLEEILEAFEQRGLVDLLHKENLQLIRELNSAGETVVALEQLFLLIDEFLIPLPEPVLVSLESLNEMMGCGLDFRWLQNAGLRECESQEPTVSGARKALIEVLHQVEARRRR